MFRILISDRLGAAGIECLDQAGDVAYDHRPGLSREALLDTIGEYDALIVRSGTQVDAHVIQAAKKLRVIGRAGMGVDNIDIRAATMRGIVVMNTPDANSVATAEQAMALMLALSRHTAPAHASVLAGEWRRSDFVGVELKEKTLGIIGFGRIGRLVAQRAQAFEMTVIAYDPYVSEQVGRDLSVTLVDLDDLLAQADIVTLHTASTPETERLIDASSIQQMKQGVRIINAARGKLIDETALAAALTEGHVAGVAVDVYSKEPPKGNPLIGLPNVLHTPHLGASTFEAQHTVATEIVDQVLRALRGEDYQNALNMSIPGGAELAGARPYLSLAEKIGVLHGALAQDAIERIEIEVSGEDVRRLVRPVAAALLKGLLECNTEESVNYINAPLIADDRGIAVSQTTGVTHIDYPNLISCRVHWNGGQRTLAGVLFGGSEPRIVQVDNYQLDANPKGTVLILQNRDVPGVIGQVGTILAAYDVNIGEWRMGRQTPGGEALSFINLDNDPPPPVLQALEKIKAITQVKLVNLA